MEDTEKIIFCTLCDYTAPRERKDNFERHMKTHFDSSVACACGKIMSSTSLSRHKQKSCRLTKGNQSKKVATMKQKEKIKCECGKIVSKTGIARHKISNSHKNGLNNNQVEHNDRVEHVEYRSVTMNVKITTQNDGSKIIEPEKITIDGISMMLMPCEPTTKLLTPAPSPVDGHFSNEGKVSILK